MTIIYFTYRYIIYTLIAIAANISCEKCNKSDKKKPKATTSNKKPAQGATKSGTTLTSEAGQQKSFGTGSGSGGGSATNSPCNIYYSIPSPAEPRYKKEASNLLLRMTIYGSSKR